MITQLIAKDWYFVRWPMLAYTAIGLVAVAMFQIDSPTLFYVGFVLLISSIIIVGVHLVFGTVVSEKKNQTLPFVLSLPVSYSQYSQSKVFGSLALFSAIWMLLVGATILTVLLKTGIPNGIIPFATIMLLELFVVFALTLSVAVVFESEIWALVVTTICNIGFSIFAYLLGQITAVAAFTESPTAVWNGTSIGIVCIEISLIVALILTTLFFQSRKTDFI